jgi:hypothetical protein
MTLDAVLIEKRSNLLLESLPILHNAGRNTRRWRRGWLGLGVEPGNAN